MAGYAGQQHGNPEIMLGHAKYTLTDVDSVNAAVAAMVTHMRSVVGTTWKGSAGPAALRATEEWAAHIQRFQSFRTNISQAQKTQTADYEATEQGSTTLITSSMNGAGPVVP